MPNKTCSMCREEKNSNLFRFKRGQCRECESFKARTYYRKNRLFCLDNYAEYRKTSEGKEAISRSDRNQRIFNPLNVRARRKLQYAVKKGDVVREPCEVCGKEKSEAHHDDYNKPYVVRWLCMYCHRAEEGRLICQTNGES